MITAHQLEVRAGARLLMEDVSFRVAAGDKVGLVGRNGAGKTTLTRILAGEGQPAAGNVTRTGERRLPAPGPANRRPRGAGAATGSSPRAGSTTSYAGCARPSTRWPRDDAAVRERGMRRYAQADAELHAGGGYAAEAEAKQIASSLGIEDRILAQPLRTLSGGQRRRVELARILFSGAETLLLDEPTNHLDADSIGWLRDFLAQPQGRADRDQPRCGSARGVRQQGAPPRRQPGRGRRLQRGLEGLPRAARDRRAAPQARAARTPRSKATTLMDQANRMRAKATKAQAAQSMLKRAETPDGGARGRARADKVAKIAFPEPASCGKTPLTAGELSKSYGSLEVFTDVDLAIDRGSRVVILGLNGAGKTTLLRILAGIDELRHRGGAARARAQARLLRAGARDARHQAHRAGEPAHGGAAAHRHRGPQRARLVPVLRRRRRQARRGALRRGEDPARAGHPGGVQRQRAAARRAHQQPRPGLSRGGAGGDPRLRGRDRAGHPRRGRGRRPSSPTGC